MSGQATMSPIEVAIISGRSLSQARSRERGKFSDEYARSVAVCEIDPEDMKELGAVDGESVRVTTRFGQVILRAAVSKQAPHRRVAFVPYGAWASMLFDPSTHTSGMPTLKGVKATIETAPGTKVATLEEITRMKAE
jgi:formylmethanofuran dehydrogenase subunit D